MQRQCRLLIVLACVLGSWQALAAPGETLRCNIMHLNPYAPEPEPVVISEIYIDFASDIVNLSEQIWGSHGGVTTFSGLEQLGDGYVAIGFHFGHRYMIAFDVDSPEDIGSGVTVRVGDTRYGLPEGDIQIGKFVEGYLESCR